MQDLRGNINISAQNIEIDGSIDSPEGVLSQINAGVEEQATGQGGSITIDVEQLSLINGGTISTATAGAGSAGLIDIEAQDIRIVSTSQAGKSSSIRADVIENATGTGGQIKVSTKTLQLDQQGEISARTAGASHGGDITLGTTQLQVLKWWGRSALKTLGSGNAGDIEIAASEVKISGQSRDRTSVSRVNAGVGMLATGDGGSIDLDVGNLSINNGARLSTATAGEGAGGIIDIQAKSIQVEGFSQASDSSTISADVLENATGPGGQVNVMAQNC